MPARELTLGDAVWSSNKSSISGGGLFTKETRPKPINELYECCDTLPNFDLVQEFRTDDLSCKKLYSNAGMFFEIWKLNMIEEAKKEAKALRKTRPKRGKNEKIGTEIKQCEKIETHRVS